ncbi:hypothetical protein A0H81_14298 [Grifola frondosa]|uniref:Uncharacterized protein n=1 Tax=Grifola frondosa TaxID=5627 RepID=A0A1C7LMH4_GRIFR|nr:hypothetical protein A0H81_14298 [Grifola frondosa]
MPSGIRRMTKTRSARTDGRASIQTMVSCAGSSLDASSENAAPEEAIAFRAAVIELQKRLNINKVTEGEGEKLPADPAQSTHQTCSTLTDAKTPHHTRPRRDAMPARGHTARDDVKHHSASRGHGTDVRRPHYRK